MEMKKFEEFYSLCERTASRQRLMGAEDPDIAYLLHGMIAAHPEEEYSLEQTRKLLDLSIKKESQKETERIVPEKEFQLFLEKTRDAMVGQCGRECGRDSKRVFLIGWVTASTEDVYTSEQLRRIFALVYE